MKGKVLKTDEGWVVEVESDLHGYGIGWGNRRVYPLLLEDEKIWIGKEVEVEVVHYDTNNFLPVLVRIKDMQPKESKSSRHFKISLIKSFLRIIAGGALYSGLLGMAGLLLILAEVLGIMEEL